jgi:hypothetical protein
MRLNELDDLCPLDDADVLMLTLYKEPPKNVRKTIRKRAALIRASWSRREREGRVVGNGGRVEWGVPCYNCHEQRIRRVCDDSADNWSRGHTTKVYRRAGSIITPRQEMRARVDNRN